ncbi:MAG TPA: Ig-like domain-containing protein [Microlunatus sp.]|nr:Ig-like domain-containing protein [Microlunatus sp.]
MPPYRRLVSTCAAAALVAACLPAGSASAAPPGAEHRPDLQTIIPTDAFSVVGSGADREFRYTHLIYDAGPGPLEIQPSYDQAIGGYRGRQLLFTHDSAGTWSPTRTVRVPDVFVYHAEHGHFHFPLASFGLYAVAPDGGSGAPVALSPKVGFCIDDSYIYNSTIEHGGTFIGSRSSCADPSGLRGISVGGADEYDYRDPGQAIPIGGVPDGTYWFKAMSDPNNDVVEADESNNETDVKVTIDHGAVTVGQVVRPDTTPPTGAISVPADGSVLSGVARVSVTSPTANVRRVDFVADGVVVGSSTATTGPWTYDWNTATAVDGEHWLSARITDSAGRTGNTGVTAVTVSNAAPPDPASGLAVIRSVSSDGRDTQTADLGTGLESGDQLLALVSSDGPADRAQSSVVTGGGLTWSLVRRANGQPGTSEAWTATVPAGAGPITITATPQQAGYDQSLTVLDFRGAAGVGASAATGSASGAPSATLTTTRAGSWVFGAGNDWNQAVGRTTGSGQELRHQWIDSSVGDTFWAQSQATPTRAAGTSVTLDDPAPAGSRWNLAAVEILPSSAPRDTTKPVVAITDPEPGSTLRGTVNIGATAADDTAVTAVRFFIDGQQIGSADTKPPFAIAWPTTGSAKGRHTITAEASDPAGNVGVSAGVVVSVDNSGPPPAKIAIETKSSKHGRSKVKTSQITTKHAGDLIVAFVAFDGPKASSQAAKVSGAGLTWTLVKRSNTQHGVSEVWSARAKDTVKKQRITAQAAHSGYDGMVTVLAFRNAAGTGVAGAAGAPRSAPSIYLPAVADASWVFAVGNDWDRAVGRVPVPDQVLQHQWRDTRAKSTFWVQSTAQPASRAGLVTIADKSPTTDRWNYTAVEVRAAPGKG